MAASSSSQSPLQVSPSSAPDTRAREACFGDHVQQVERFERERRQWATGPAPASHHETRPEVLADEYDDSSTDSSDTDSLASEDSFSPAYRRFQVSMRETIQLAADCVEVAERWRELAIEGEGNGYSDEERESQGEDDDHDDEDHDANADEDDEPLPQYEHVETLPPNYESAAAARVGAETTDGEREPQAQQLSWFREPWELRARDQLPEQERRPERRLQGWVPAFMRWWEI